MDMISITTAVSSLKSMSDIIKALDGLRLSSEVKKATMQLIDKIIIAQTSIMDAQAKQSAMIQRINDLEKEVMKIKAWEKEKKRYQLISPWIGSLVYAIKESRKKTDPPHWICTKCYEDGRKSILNPYQLRNNSKRSDYLYRYGCPVCKSEIQSHYASVQEPEYAI